MEIEKTALFEEINTIIKEGPKPVSFKWKAKIHVKDKDFEPIKIIDIDFKKDYSNNFADEITVKFLLGLGLWSKVIYPARTELEITLFKHPLKEITDQKEEDEEIESMRFTAVPVLEGLPVITGKNLDVNSLKALDLKDVFDVTFQLFDKSIEQLRMVTVGGIFRRCTPEDVIKSLLAKESAKIKLKSGTTIDGVDFIEPDNKEKREHILIPQGTRLMDVAQLIQKRIGGVYNTALNCYYQNKYWFVFPLYNTTRLNKATKTAVILKVPKERFTGLERTYRQDGDILYIIGTSNSDLSDDAGTNFLNSGNGVRFSDSRRYLRDIVEKKDNKAIIKRTKVNHEFIFEKDEKPKEEPLNNVQLSNDRINSNPFAERSALSSKYGMTYQFDWENADPTLLFPGMMIKIHYLDKTEMKELHGVLLYVHASVQMFGQGLTSSKHVSTVKMIIFANKPPGSAEKESENESEQDDENDDETKAIDDWTKFESI